jgi:hypothetical protein
MNRYTNDYFLAHYGVKGMKWGRRKNIYDVNANYYNKRADKLTAKANRNRTMANLNSRAASQGKGLISKANNFNANYYNKRADKIRAKADKNRTMASMNEAASKQRQDYKNSPEGRAQAERTKKAVKVGAAVVGTALTVYGGYKLSKFAKNKYAKEVVDEIVRDYGPEKIRYDYNGTVSEIASKVKTREAVVGLAKNASKKRSAARAYNRRAAEAAKRLQEEAQMEYIRKQIRNQKSNRTYI